MISQFYVAYISKETAEDLQKKLLKVSEVEKVEVIRNCNSGVPRSERKELPQEQATTPGQAASVQEAEPQVKATDKKSATTNKTNVPTASKTIRVNIERLDVLMNLFEELVIDRGRLLSIAAEVNHSELNETVERMSRTMGDLQNIILTMRMVPVETVFNRFPKMVRQLSRDLNKKINLEIIGAETELDRTVIDEIGDPLVHLIRNSLDHGIESPEIRRQKVNQKKVQFILRAYHSGNYVFIEIEDDGAGINREKVLA